MLVEVVLGAFVGALSFLIATFLPKSDPHKGKKYSVEYDRPSNSNEGPVLRSLIRDPNKLLDYPQPDVTTLWELLSSSTRKYGNRNSIGTRSLLKIHTEEKEIVKKIEGKEVKELKKWEFCEMGPYCWITYSQLLERVKHIGKALVSNQIGIRPTGKLGIFCQTCPEWFQMLHGCASQSITVVTVYANLGDEGLIHAINEGELEVLFTSSDLIPSLFKIKPQCPTLKKVIYVNTAPQPLDKFKFESNFDLLSFEDILALGKQNESATLTPPSPNDLMMIMYTSGTTGVPKGVMITHANLLAIITAGHTCVDIKPDDIYIAFLPLAHVLELAIENALLVSGSSIGYANPRTLTDASVRNCRGDITELRPTLMAGVPAIWERIRKGALDKVANGPPLVRAIFNASYTIKKALVDRGYWNAPILDQIVFKKIKDQVGGRLRLIVSGGAPLSSDTQQFLRAAFSCNCLQGYGLTETCGLVSLMPLDHTAVECVGAPVPCVELKLVDVPEMSYKSTDKPYPRGEILVKGNNITMGYFKRPQETSEVYLEDGWFATGDVGQLYPNGTLAIIDRKKNLVKLSGGEYIALEKLESLYKTSTLVENVCVYGDAFQDFPVALVVPAKNQLESWATSNNISSSDWQDLCSKEEAKSVILKSLQEIAKAHRLKTLEVVQAVSLVPDEWTPENDLLTAALKLKRRNIVHKYQYRINSMYS